MKKDNFGICINFYAVLGFVLALLGHTTLALLLLGFVIVVHKDQWLTMQVMQAFFLSIISGVVSAFIGILSPLYSIPILGALISTLFGIVTSIISLIILILAIIGIINTAKGADANLPLVKGFANKAFGIVKNVTYTQSAPQDPNNSNNTQN
ncbi:MAG: hypothetical protein K2K21_17170 [Lachnospiraceae bacterium]|nr:hypothetical protein [Lachnospiraceae bacterium]